MTWKIMYNIERNFMNENNHSDSTIVESEEVTGETAEVTINNLVNSLKINGYLQSVVSAEALNSDVRDGYYYLEIISFDEIKFSMNVDTFNVFSCPAFKTLVDDRKKKHAREQKAKELSQNAKLKQFELKLLKDLQEKYFGVEVTECG